MGIECRMCRADDHHALADLFTELQAFHHLPPQSRTDILGDIDRMPENFEVWLAVDDNGAILGFALTSIHPGPGIAPALYLKELFVTSTARTGGVGRALMQAVAQAAIRRGIRRVDWVTARDNARVRAFYDRLGAVPQESKVFYRLEAEALSGLANDTD